MRSRRLALPAFLGLVVLCSLFSWTARGDDAPGLASQIAAPWPARQAANGTFADYSRGLSFEYAEAMLGYGLLQEGIRQDDRRLTQAGLHGISFAARVNPGRIDGVFQHMALASAYNLARERHYATPPPLAGALRRMRPFFFGSGQHYMNKYLVETVSVLELLRSGLRSNVHGSILARPAWARQQVSALLGRVLPRAARGAGSGQGGAAMLSDPPVDPLAYHALSLGMLGRTVELLGPRAPAGARALLREMANASWQLTAPDGDLAYFGRSQEQSWTLAMTAYGARVAALDAPDGEAARYRGLAARALSHLRDEYSGGPGGIWITPELGRGGRGLDGMDHYADGAAYTGLTLVALEWAEELGGSEGDTAGLGSDSTGGHVMDRGDSRFAVVRSARTWFAVKLARTGVRDMRYDFGIVAAKALRPSGWRDLVHLRPMDISRPDSAGPVLHVRGGVAFPKGRNISVAPDRVTVSGAFVTPEGRTVRPALFTFRADGDCIVLEFQARAGERFDYSSFEPPARDSRTEFDPPAASAGTVGGYASGADPRLVRTRTELVPGARTERITTCPAA